MEEKIIDLLLKLDQGELNIAQTAREIQELNNFNQTDIFHQGVKYAKELEEKSGKGLSIDTISDIAKYYAKHVNHFIQNNLNN